MKQSVYVETSVISYLTARRSRDLVIAAHQELTHQWWQTRLPGFDVFVSELVLEESRAGDEDAAGRRLSAIEGVSVLRLNDEAIVLATKLVDEGPIPREFGADALHIALAAVNGTDYLLTWNCKHLANAAHRHKTEMLVEAVGYACPVICTPEELMED